jgi:hypothetical protein
MKFQPLKRVTRQPIPTALQLTYKNKQAPPFGSAYRLCWAPTITYAKTKASAAETFYNKRYFYYFAGLLY